LGETTDIEKLTREGKVFEKNGEQIEVKPMVIADSDEFKKKVGQTLREIIEQYEDENWQELIEIIDNILGDELLELSKVACEDLRRLGDDWIKKNLTLADLQTILAEVIKRNFPWVRQAIELGQLGKLQEEISRRANQ